MSLLLHQLYLFNYQQFILMNEIQNLTKSGRFSQVATSSLNSNKQLQKMTFPKLKTQNPEATQELISPVKIYVNKVLEELKLDAILLKKQPSIKEKTDIKTQKKDKYSRYNNLSKKFENLLTENLLQELEIPTNKVHNFEKRLKKFQSKGCSLSKLVTQKSIADTKQQQQSNRKIQKFAYRQFKNQIKHLRKGMRSLRVIKTRK